MKKDPITYSPRCFRLSRDGVTRCDAPECVAPDDSCLLLFAPRMQLTDFLQSILAALKDASEARTNSTPGTVDQRVLRAIQTLRAEGLLRSGGDLTWVVLAMNATDGLPHQPSAQAWLNYLHAIGLDDLPSRSTLGQRLYAAHGRVGEWTFTDPLGRRSTNEARRRNAIALRFLELVRA